jgi:hypothetical protein
MSMTVGGPVLTVMSGCDMDLLGGAMSITQRAEATLCQRVNATYCMQIVMYTTGVVLKITVQCSCSQTQLYCSKGSVQVLHLEHENIWGAGGMIPHIFNPGTRRR